MTGIVVVGAGTAGCVIAAGLSARADVHVTLIEAGPDLRPGDAAAGVRSASFFDALAEPGRTWPSEYAQGRGVGGSSAVNGMVATTPAHDLIQRWGLGEIAPLGRLATDAEHGPMDRALLAAEPAARPVALTLVDGARQTVADVHLEPMRVADRLQVVTGSPVARVVVDHGRATGVVLVDGTTVGADTVVVSAGAIHSPAVLVRSCVDLGAIEVFDHPSITLHVDLHPHVEVDVHGPVASSVLRGDGVEIVPINHDGPDRPGRAAMLAALMRPEGMGRIDVTEDPEAEPSVQFSWTTADLARLGAAEEVMRELLARPAFADVVSDVDATADAGGYFHACGSCRHVVDRNGAVNGVDGLFVCDASTFPELPPTGPMVATIAWAQRFADRLALG